MKFVLKHPITVGSSTIDSLTLRDHTRAEDYLAFDQRGGVAQRIALIASVAGTDEALVKQLHGADYRRAEEQVNKLLEADEAAVAEDVKQAAQGDGGAPSEEAKK